MEATTLTDEVREKIVLALTTTRREQCTRWYGLGEKRCANGVIAEALGVPLFAGIGHIEDGEQVYMLHRPSLFEQVPIALSVALASANNNGASFDECAKIAKDWQPTPVPEWAQDTPTFTVIFV
jgi:hypothetical protein